MNPQLSTNFSLKELTRSDTAIRKGIDNTPDNEQLINLTHLSIFILQPVRDKFGSTTVNSGLRVLELNRAIGSSDTSQHRKGEAAGNLRQRHAARALPQSRLSLDGSQSDERRQNLRERKGLGGSFPRAAPTSGHRRRFPGTNAREDAGSFSAAAADRCGAPGIRAFRRATAPRT